MGDFWPPFNHNQPEPQYSSPPPYAGYQQPPREKPRIITELTPLFQELNHTIGKLNLEIAALKETNEKTNTKLNLEIAALKETNEKTNTKMNEILKAMAKVPHE